MNNTYKVLSLTIGILLLMGSHLSCQTFAAGQITEATGAASSAMGLYTNASGDASTAMGFHAKATGTLSISMGEFTTADNTGSVALGSYTTASGIASTAMGAHTTASGSYSSAMGRSTTASASSSTAIGLFNTEYTPTNGDTDRLFVIGNGFNLSARSDALYVQRDGQLYIRNKSDDVGKYDLYMAGHGRAATQGSFVFRLDVNNNANESFYITNSTGGTIARIREVGNTTFNAWVDATDFNATSDVRYKKDISTLSSSLVNIDRIRGVRYNWDQDAHPEKYFGDQPQIGFIAQELEAIYPELVRTDEDGYKSVAYNKMTAVLVEAVKELNEKVMKENEVLKLEISTMKKQLYKIALMEARLSNLEVLEDSAIK